MKEYLEREIKRGAKLTVMQDRINKAAANGMITMEEKDTLDAMLLANANAGENAPELRQMVVDLAARVAALEAYHAEQPEQPEEPDIPEDTGYPAWEPWDGISDKYQMGAIVSHNDKLWESTFHGQNTWEPGVIGTEALWREFTA